MIGSHLNIYTFEYLIEEALSMAPSTVDKRQGAIIYDTMSVSDVQLAQGYIELKGYYLDTYALTAEEIYLEMRCGERGIHRYPATAPVKKGVFKNSEGNPVQIPMGYKFSTESDTNALICTVTDVHREDDITIPGEYQLTFETLGAAGNDYTGNLIRLSNTTIKGLASAEMTDLLVPGGDAESDDALRERYIEFVNRPPFGGNISSYKDWILKIDGVGAVQVYPIWNGGGTVKCSIVGKDFLPASETLIDKVQTEIDPEQNQGLGLGLAPIGALVTITAPEASIVNFSANVSLASGVFIVQVQVDIEAAISNYLATQRTKFGKITNANTYSLNIYRAQIISSLMEVIGILNVTNVLINNVDADLELEQSSQSQYLPVLGSVVLDEI